MEESPDSLFHFPDVMRRCSRVRSISIGVGGGVFPPLRELQTKHSLDLEVGRRL